MRTALLLPYLVVGCLAVLPPPPAAASRDDDPWFQSARQAVARAAGRAPAEERARNVVLFVGDGMGPTTIAAARIFEGQLRGGAGEENLLSFETLPEAGLLKVYNTDQQVPDSAGTMTAIVSGVKTRAGVLGLDARSVPNDYRSAAWSRVPTLLEEAEERGLATGIVTTTRITHATPAATYAHSPSRAWEDDSALPVEARADGFPDLARQLVEFDVGDGIDVALGGGRLQFLPSDLADPEEPELAGLRTDGRDLVAEWQARHPDGVFVWNRAQFDALDPERTRRVLGLFDPSHMEFEVERAADRGGEPSLAEMTALALRVLSQHEEGFILVVEGGRIDHGHHFGNAYRALSETVELAQAVRVALEATRPEETLVVVTADHGHTLTFGGYTARGSPILGLVRSGRGDYESGAGLALDAAGRPYTILGYANGPGHLSATNLQREGVKRHPHSDPLLFRSTGSVRRRPDLSAVDTTGPDYLQEATVPRFSETHGGQDVSVHAGGPGAALFHGVQEQHYVYHAIVAALGWTDPNPPAEPAERPWWCRLPLPCRGDDAGDAAD